MSAFTLEKAALSRDSSMVLRIMWGFILVLIIVSVEIAECVGSVLGVCWVSVERKPFLCKEKPSGKSFFLQERKNLGKKETKNGKGKLQERKNLGR